MHTSLRLPSQGLAQVRRGRLDPSAGVEQVCRSVEKREEEAEISRLAPFLSLKVFVLSSRKKNNIAAARLSSLDEGEQHPRAGRLGADIRPGIVDAGACFLGI